MKVSRIILNYCSINACHKFVLTILVIAGLITSSTLRGNAQNLTLSDFVKSSSELVEFLEAPEDILDVDPVRHQNLPLKWQKIYEASKPKELKVIKFSDENWESLKKGLFITAAFLNAYYSNEKYKEVWVLARDPLVLGYIWKLFTNEKGLKIKFLGVSRFSVQDPNLVPYLNEMGFSNSHFEMMAQRGEKALILDSAFKMSIGKKLKEQVSPQGQKALSFQLNSSMVSDVPDTLFLDQLVDSPIRPVDYMGHLPKSTGRVVTYRQIDGKWTALAAPGNDKYDMPASISEKSIPEMLEDIKASFIDYEKEINEIETIIKGLNSLVRIGNRERLVEVLRKIINGKFLRGYSTRQREAMVSSWLEMHTLNPIYEDKIFEIHPKEIGLNWDYMYGKNGVIDLNKDKELIRFDFTRILKKLPLDKNSNRFSTIDFSGLSINEKISFVSSLSNFLKRRKGPGVPPEIYTIIDKLYESREWKELLDGDTEIHRIWTSKSCRNILKMIPGS